MTSGYGGIGRRARFRFWCPRRAGSSPVIRRNNKKDGESHPFLLLRTHSVREPAVQGLASGSVGARRCPPGTSTLLSADREGEWREVFFSFHIRIASVNLPVQGLASGSVGARRCPPGTSGLASGSVGARRCPPGTSTLLSAESVEIQNFYFCTVFFMIFGRKDWVYFQKHDFDRKRFCKTCQKTVGFSKRRNLTGTGHGIW